MGWKALFFAMGILFLVAACSSSSGRSETTGSAAESPEATESSDAPETSGSNVTGEPLEGGRFVRLFVAPPTLDPHLTTDATSAQVIVEVFGGLVTIDKDLNVVPDLAESWNISQDLSLIHI